MGTITQQIEPRTTKGKRVKSLRRQGVTPANVFGPGLESEAIQALTADLEKTLSKSGFTQLITLKSPSGADRRVLAKEIQRDSITGQLLHVGFHQVRLTDRVKVSVPLAFEGDAPASRRKDLVFLENLGSIEVECLPTEIPEKIVIDISELAEAGDRILVSSITLGEGISISTHPEEIVASVSQAKTEAVIEEAEEEAIEEAEAAQPEGEQVVESSEESSE